MEVACPNCGTAGQVAGKFCESCGYAIPADAGQPDSAGQSAPAGQASPDVAAPVASGQGPDQAAQSGVTITGPVPQPGGAGLAQGVGAQFAVVRDGAANLNEGFTINRAGEFLVGRMDQETGHQVDIDTRQWVEPIEVGGQKQYLVHRKQCYIVLAADGVVSLRSCPGAEADTLVRGPGETTFTSLQNLGTMRTARPDGSFELQLHEQIFMGDPEAVMYYVSGDPTAQSNYLVVELINKSV